MRPVRGSRLYADRSGSEPATRSTRPACPVDEARDRRQRDEDVDQAKERHRNSIGWTSQPRPEETRKAGQGSSDGAIVPTSGPQCDAPVIARSKGRIVIDLLVDHGSYDVQVTDCLFWACKPTAQNAMIADLAG